jgi:RNA polymerase sigma-70 factor (ECF subfamily)
MTNPKRERVRAELGHAQTRERLVRTARRVLGEPESEDAAHDAVVQALAAAERFRDDAQVGTWLHRIAFNAALMSYRKRTRSGSRLSRAQREAVDARWLGHGEPEETAAAALEGDEIRRILRNAVAQLPETYREVIELCVYDEKQPGPVSQVLGITASAVRTRVSRAQDRLRKLMAAGE